MSHPLLTRVLADAHHGSRSMKHRFAFIDPTKSHDPRCHDAGIALALAIPPDIADRLERALDVCAVCGMWSGWSDHEENQTVKALIGGSFHPYQPLVTP